MKLFEKIYPLRVEGNQLYYEGDLFFNRSNLNTNIPRRMQRHYRVPATNPEYAERSLSVKDYIFAVQNIEKCAFACFPPSLSK